MEKLKEIIKNFKISVIDDGTFFKIVFIDKKTGKKIIIPVNKSIEPNNYGKQLH